MTMTKMYTIGLLEYCYAVVLAYTNSTIWPLKLFVICIRIALSIGHSVRWRIAIMNGRSKNCHTDAVSALFRSILCKQKMNIIACLYVRMLLRCWSSA